MPKSNIRDAIVSLVLSCQSLVKFFFQHFQSLRSSNLWSNRRRASAPGGSTPANPTPASRRSSTVSRDLSGMWSLIPWLLAKWSLTMDPRGRRDTPSLCIWLELDKHQDSCVNNDTLITRDENLGNCWRTQHCRHRRWKIWDIHPKDWGAWGNSWTSR